MALIFTLLLCLLSHHVLLVVTISSKFHTQEVTAVNEANGSNETEAGKKQTA